MQEVVVVWRDQVGSSVLLAVCVANSAYRRVIASFCSSRSIEGRTMSANQALSTGRRQAQEQYVFVAISLTEDNRSECRRRVTEEGALPSQCSNVSTTAVVLAGSARLRHGIQDICVWRTCTKATRSGSVQPSESLYSVQAKIATACSSLHTKNDRTSPERF